MRIGFDQGGVRQAVHLCNIGFAIDALLLPFKNARSGQRGDAHAVTDEDDDIARLITVGRIRLQPGKLGCASLQIGFARRERRRANGPRRRQGSRRRRSRRIRRRRILRDNRRGDQAGRQKGG